MSVKVDQALLSHFNAQSFGVDVAHENAALTPGAGPFVSLSVLSNDVEMYTIAGQNDVTGFLQFILRYPEGEGAIGAKAKRAEIFAAYPLGSQVRYDGQTVHIVSYSSPQAEPEDGFYKLIGRINFRAFITR